MPDNITINVRGRLMDMSETRIMGIVNVTPDSFYAESRKQTEHAIISRVKQILDEGADIIDIGAFSTRPGASQITEIEEMERLRQALVSVVREFPEAVISVDTFRAAVAKMCVEEYGASIVNDISGGELDRRMFSTISALHVPYILMHMRGNPQTMQSHTDYNDLLAEICIYFEKKIRQLCLLGVNDIILDPGFGFAKTLEQNYTLLAHLEEFKLFKRPLLVGVSRKSMIYKLLNTTPEEALNGTTCVNMLALTKGARILRTHDVKAANEARIIYEAMTKQA